MLIAEHLKDIWPNPDVFGPTQMHSYERIVNVETIQKIQRWEVFKPKKYLDVVDKNGKEWYCIGFGHGGASGVWPSHEQILNDNLVITRPQAVNILLDDLRAEYVPRTSKLIKCNINTFMFGAMVMCAFNMGMTRFAKTSMVTHLNNGKYIAACAALKNYNKQRNPITLQLEEKNGLTCRRMDEGSLFLTKLGE